MGEGFPQGQVLFFLRNPATGRFEEQQRLPMPDGRPGPRALDLSGDVVVAATGGAIDVFVRSSGADPFAHRQTIVERGAFLPDIEYGAAMALDGDHLLVGAPRANPGDGALLTGGLYTYRFDGGTGRFFHPGVIGGLPSFAGRFGASVALGGGVAAVGAPNDQFPAGVMHLFSEAPPPRAVPSGVDPALLALALLAAIAVARARTATR